MQTRGPSSQLVIAYFNATYDRINRQVSKKITETSQSHVDFSSLLCSLFGTEWRKVEPVQWTSSPKKTPRQPSRMLISHSTCALYLEQIDEYRADIQVCRGGIEGDFVAVRLCFGWRCRGDCPIAVR